MKRGLKRFSDRGGHSTMAELNVTPMLDLAFVLLIIFIITTPLMEGSLEINLPSAAAKTPPPEAGAVKTVEVDRSGAVSLAGRRCTLPELEAELARLHAADPKLAVVVRADRDLRYQQLVDVFDALQRAQVTRLGLMHLDADAPAAKSP
ncbi:MAG: biopolymer transporter ExbD [Verrucomicrobium sp.]|nr:biopolymer transporter ExbD [Verrucomicrobium sp.]